VAQVHGSKGKVLASNSLAATAVQVAKVSHWTMDMGSDTVEVTGMQDANKTYVQGLPDRKGTLEFWFDDTNEVVFTGAKSTTGTFLYLYINATLYSYGPAFISASLDSSVDGAVKGSGNWVASAAWTDNWG
jgi:hypothetical protein